MAQNIYRRRSPGERPRRSLLPFLLPILALSLLALGAVTYRLPYYAVGPGPVHRVSSLLSVPPDRAFPVNGEFLLTSVSLRDVTPFTAALARLDPDVELVRARTVVGTDPTPEARRRFDAGLRRSMQRSQHVAVGLAFDRLGLAPPDPGDPVRPVTVDAAGVGGASAGLALTLGLIDALADGDLTGGRRVAVTGTIAPNGRVGEVDGVGQKAAAARAAGAQVLLVPPGNLGEALPRAGAGMEVVTAASLDEALAALARLGGEVGRPAAPTMS